MRMDPSAAASATADPEISAKNIEVTMVTCASAPRTKPGRAEESAISRREMPDAFMIAPANTNSGMAISGKLVAPVYITMGTLASCQTPPVCTMATSATTASATAIGMPNRTSTITAPKRASISISGSAPWPLRRPRRPGRWPSLRPGDVVRQIEQLRQHEQGRADGDDRLGEAHGHVYRDQGLAAEHLQDVHSPYRQHDEEADHRDLAHHESDDAAAAGEGVDQARETDVRFLQGGERAGVVGEPGEHYRGHLVVPDQRPARGAEDDAEQDLDRECEEQRRRDPLEEPLDPAAQRLHLADPSDAALSIISLPFGVSLANSS